MKIRAFSFVCLISIPAQIRSEISLRDISIAATSGLGVGLAAILITKYVADQYHPAALAQAKLEIEQEEKEKKEKQEAEQKENEQWRETQKNNALHHVRTLARAYQREIQHLTTDKKKQIDKSRFMEYIKAKCNDKKMPLKVYYESLKQDLTLLQSLQKNGAVEGLDALITNLEAILHNYNFFISDDLKAEQTAVDQQKRQEEAEQRKIEKEKLEIKKLETEIKTFEDVRHEMRSMEHHIEKIGYKIDKQERSCFNSITDLISSLNIFRSKQAQAHDEMQKTLAKNHAEGAGQYANIMRSLEHLTRLISALRPQQHRPDYAEYPRPPAYNPELNAQPAPSAPPA